MKTSYRLLLLALLLRAPVVWGIEPPAGQQVLILEGDRTLEGEVSQVGDSYQVRRSIGLTILPASRVRRVCASKEEAYEFLRREANLIDPDERLRLARWCHLQGLKKQAAEEAAEAVRLRPGHEESQRLLGYLRQAAEQKPAPARAAPPRPPASPAAALLRETPVELSAEAMNLFTTRVQPILMNACASCHASGQTAAFSLKRSYGSDNRKALRENLAAVLGQLNLRQPELSPLLIKAASAHGSSTRAPLGAQHAEALKTLQRWVKLTVAGDPRLKETFSVKDDPAPSRLPAVPTAKPETRPESKPASEPARPSAAGPVSRPEPVAEPLDEYDPRIFNRQMHPDRPPSP